MSSSGGRTGGIRVARARVRSSQVSTWAGRPRGDRVGQAQAGQVGPVPDDGGLQVEAAQPRLVPLQGRQPAADLAPLAGPVAGRGGQLGAHRVAQDPGPDGRADCPCGTPRRPAPRRCRPRRPGWPTGRPAAAAGRPPRSAPGRPGRPPPRRCAPGPRDGAPGDRGRRGEHRPGHQLAAVEPRRWKPRRALRA